MWRRFTFPLYFPFFFVLLRFAVTPLRTFNLRASFALPTLSALIRAQRATHSSQMKTLRDVARLLDPPSMRLRTSCCDLPQNEQDNCFGAVLRDIWQAPSWGCE
jgi:hypothetical protein